MISERVFVATDCRYAVEVKGPDSKLGFALGQIDGGFLGRYKSGFRSVYAIARPAKSEAEGERSSRPVNVLSLEKLAGRRAVSAGVLLVEETAVFRRGVSLAGLLRLRSIVGSIGRNEVLLLRLPSVVGVAAFICWLLRRAEFRPTLASELVADARMVYGTDMRAFGAVADVLVRMAIKKSVAVSAVTQGYLQDRYPEVGRRPITAIYSSVSLSDEWISAEPREYREPAEGLVVVASLDGAHKGVDVLLRALLICSLRGVSYPLTVVGGGSEEARLRELAQALGLTPQVRFVGRIPRSQVRTLLDAADLFVLPSRAEALPRALIEAMARGLPAVASDVGGVSELLDRQYLVPADDPVKLADVITQLSKSPSLLSQQSKRNWLKSQEYSEAVLSLARDEFYRAVAGHSKTL